VLDNTLSNGRVLEDAPDSEAARAIQRFNEQCAPKIVSVLLTVRDGVTLIRPKGGE
jgi:predicted O-methyltransferase YrrM